MVGVASTNDVVEILTSSEHNPEKGLALPHSHIVLIPHPSDDPRDPLVCFMLFLFLLYAFYYLVLLYLTLYSCILFISSFQESTPFIIWSVYHTHIYPS